MTFVTLDKSLEKFEPIVLEAAKILEDDLNNKVIFTLKVQLVNVYIGFASSSKKHTSGLCYKEGDKLHIAIFVNPQDPLDYITFVISHELGHLLWKKMTDVLFMTGKANDDSTELTSVIRITSNSEQYGRQLEEQLCDIIALRIVKKIGFSEFSDFLKRELQKNAKKRMAVESFISTFGDRLDECDCIDAYENKDDCCAAKNSFWYFAVTSGISQIVNYYDSIMGESAYYDLCEALDSNDLGYFKKEIKRFQKIEKNRVSGQ